MTFLFFNHICRPSLLKFCPFRLNDLVWPLIYHHWASERYFWLLYKRKHSQGSRSTLIWSTGHFGPLLRLIATTMVRSTAMATSRMLITSPISTVMGWHLIAVTAETSLAWLAVTLPLVYNKSVKVSNSHGSKLILSTYLFSWMVVLCSSMKKVVLHCMANDSFLDNLYPHNYSLNY